MYKYVIFDLDGTLADTLADLAASINFSLEKNALPTYKVDDYRSFVGDGIDKLIERVLADNYSEALLKETKEVFFNYYSEHFCDYTKSYDGMPGLLKELDDLYIKTAVISNKPHQFVPQILSKLYPDHKFEYTWGQKPNFERKPDPQLLLLLLSLLGAEKSEALYVGDSNVDIKFAHSAGIKACGVSWGFRGREELIKSGADFIADNTNELKNVIMMRNNE